MLQLYSGSNRRFGGERTVLSPMQSLKKGIGAPIVELS